MDMIYNKFSNHGFRKYKYIHVQNPDFLFMVEYAIKAPVSYTHLDVYKRQPRGRGSLSTS